MAGDGNKMYTYTNVLTHRVDHDASCTMCAWWRNNDEEADADDDGQQLPVRMITIMMMILQTMMALMAQAMMGVVLAGVPFRPHPLPLRFQIAPCAAYAKLTTSATCVHELVRFLL